MKRILGIDLAWGEKMPDAVAVIDWCKESGRVVIGGYQYAHGDEALRLYLKSQDAEILAVDAPTICHNETGARPVDKECSRLFREHEAGCHPVNLRLCQRPIRVAEMCRALGYHQHWRLQGRAMIEVFPHPAMVRWFVLDKTIKYKKGRVAAKKVEFARYQQSLSDWLHVHWPTAEWSELFSQVMQEPWSKRTEDLLDAYFCALIGLWHLAYQGKRSQVLGDEQSGFIVIPIGS